MAAPDLEPATGNVVAVPPAVGTVARSVLNLLSYYRSLCRREFAEHDIYEVSARIGELRALGFRIGSRPCKRHDHRARRGLVEYYLEPPEQR